MSEIVAYIKRFEFLWHADDFTINKISNCEDNEIIDFRKRFYYAMYKIKNNFISSNIYNRVLENAISLDIFMNIVIKSSGKKLSGDDAMNRIIDVYNKMSDIYKTYETKRLKKSDIHKRLNEIDSIKRFMSITGYKKENKFKIFENDIEYYALALIIYMDDYNNKKTKSNAIAFTKNGTFKPDLVYEYLYRKTLKYQSNFYKQLYRFDTYTNILLMYLTSDFDAGKFDKNNFSRYLYTLYKYEKKTKLLSFFHYLNLVQKLDFKSIVDKKPKDKLDYIFPIFFEKLDMTKINIENMSKSIFEKIINKKNNKSDIYRYNNIMRNLILNMENSIFLKLVLMDMFSKFIDFDDDKIRIPNERTYKYLDKLIINANFSDFLSVDYNNDKLINMVVQVLCDYWKEEDTDSQLDRIDDYINANDINLMDYSSQRKLKVIFRFYEK